MWFKQAQIFQLPPTIAIAYDKSALTQQLKPFMFKSCLPHFASTCGWVSPREDADIEPALVHAANGYLLICLQFEEKILPSIVIKQTLNKKIEQLEKLEGKKIPQKEKYTLKEQIITTLLPKAFSKLSTIYAYFDTKNNWLILNTANTLKTQKFMDFLKKTIPEMVDIKPIINHKITDILTQWLMQKEYPNVFSIEKSCVLVDENQKNRIIRCQQQDLFAHSVIAFIKDNCTIRQMGMNWQNNIYFTLREDLALLNLRFPDKVIEQTKTMEPETEQEQFDADFFIMTEIFSGLSKDLLDLL